MRLKEVSSSIPTRFRLGLTQAIVIMVISSPIIMLVNPIQVSAVTTRNSNEIDTSGYHSNMPISSTPPTSTVSQDGDFTTQAALGLTRAAQTNNFVASKADYDISFRTATAGVIKSIVMDFPAGTSVGSALVVEAVGIGPGTLAASAGEVLTYTVTNAVNVPALTNIRIQISNINNPSTPSGSLTVSITTRDAASATIDGPTPTSAYNLVQVGNAQIAPGAVTTTKIATGAVSSTDVAKGFMKKVVLTDSVAGNARGWDPNGVTTSFTITGEPDISNTGSMVSIVVADPAAANHFCDVTFFFVGIGFAIECSSAPFDTGLLHYVVENLPPDVVD